MNLHRQQHVKVTQQNLNKTLTAQLHMLNSTKLDEWDILLLQEPWMTFNGTRATPHWRVLYPETFFADKTKPLRSIILVSTRIPTNSYEQIQFGTADVTGIMLKTDGGTIDLINVYNC